MIELILISSFHSIVFMLLGGLGVIMCPCGIVYSIKFNLRAESPRDFADLLLSWKHFPNITIYDYPRGLVAHTNNRQPLHPPFHPFEGRVQDPSSENIQKAKEGKLKVNLPWLAHKKKPMDPECHPLTGSSEHYCLCDVFHQGNSKDKRDVLRTIGLVPELAGKINSQCAEQLFSEVKRNNYFMNMLRPSAHIFSCSKHPSPQESHAEQEEVGTIQEIVQWQS